MEIENTTVTESSWGPTALDKEAEALIKQISSEFTPEPEPVEATDAPATETAPQTPAPSAKSPESAPEAKAHPLEIDKLIARELELRDQRAAFEREKAEFANKKPADEEVRDLFSSSAVKALEKLGYDPDQIVRRVIAERMGEKAPEKLKQEIELSDKESKYLRRIDEIEKKLAMREREAAQRAYFDHINNGAKDYVTKGIGEYAPTVASIARTNPDRVHREIMDELIRDAQVRAQKDPNGELLPFEEAAKRVESRWSELRGLFTPSQSTAPTSTKTEAKVEPKPTEKTSTTTTKPPDRPLAPWLQTKPIEDEGVKAGMAEYYRLLKEGKD